MGISIRNRLGAISGLLAGLGLFFGQIFTDLAPNSPFSSSQSIVRVFGENQRDLLVGSYLTMIGSFFLFWFATYLWSYFKEISKEEFWIHGVIIAGGISAATIFLVSAHFTQSFTIVQNYLGDDSVAKALYILDYNWALLFEAPALSAFTLAITISSFSAGVFAKLVNWTGLGISLLLLAPFIPGSGVMLALIWFSLISVMLTIKVWNK